MEITFSNKKLEKLANDYRLCQKEMGQIRAKLFHKRLQNLRIMWGSPVS
jgi:proteic killer suppression protein